MTRFFFHVHDGKSYPDHEGTELPSWKAARLDAVARVGQILAEEPERIGVGEDWSMEVTDEHGLVLFRLDFHVTASPAARQD